jgi:hypothetical protein
MGITAPSRTRVGIIVLGLAAVLLAAVIALVPRGAEPASARVHDGRFRQFLEMSRAAGFDYESSATPAELADRVDGVFAGRIVAVRPGQSYSTVPGGEAIFATSVIEVEVTDELAGSSGKTGEGSAYLQIRHPAYVGRGDDTDFREPYDLEAFARTVPMGAPVTLFVYDITHLVDPAMVIDEGSGRRAGAQLQSAAVQGFWLDPTGHDLASVFEPVDAMGDGWRGIRTLADLEAAIVAH